MAADVPMVTLLAQLNGKWMLCLEWKLYRSRSSKPQSLEKSRQIGRYGSIIMQVNYGENKASIRVSQKIITYLSVSEQGIKWLVRVLVRQSERSSDIIVALG